MCFLELSFDFVSVLILKLCTILLVFDFFFGPEYRAGNGRKAGQVLPLIISYLNFRFSTSLKLTCNFPLVS